MPPAHLRLTKSLFAGESIALSADSKERPHTYPLQKPRLYMSVVTAALSTILAAVILLHRENSILLLSSYLISMLVIAVATFKLRIRFLQIGKPDTSEGDLPQATKSVGLRRLLLVFLILLITLAIPLLMARILPLLLGTLGYYVWFMLVVSIASGVSIAEILLYLHIR